METLARRRSLLVWLLPLGMLMVVYLLWANDEVVRSAQGGSVVDTSDPRRLVGYSDAVFVGRVIEQVGSVEPADNPFPRTQFRVQVLQSIKAARRVNNQAESLPSEPAPLPDVVVVDQYGGHTRNAAGKEMLLLMNDVPLLKPGQAYLLATRYSEEGNWYHVLESNHAAVPIGDAAELAALVESFTAANREQIPFDFSDLHNKPTGEQGTSTEQEAGQP